MRKWLVEVQKDLHEFGRQFGSLLHRGFTHHPSRHDRLFMVAGIALAATTLGVALVWTGRAPDFQSIFAPPESIQPQPVIDLKTPVRKEPARFAPNTHLPRMKELVVSGTLSLPTFLPKYDLVSVDDARVWWESDNDTNDVENDHIVNAALEEPLRRLIELVSQAGGTLKVQDSYREEGIHLDHSLHKEGRAVDLTCDELGLEKLAKLAWAAGFDWVYYETPRKGGAHVHASVRTER
jgi:hypothetical protein